MPSSIIGGRLPNGKYKEVSLDASGRLECSVNEIEITADSINVKTQNVETLLNGGLPSALTGSGNLKVCLQELGNEGSERLNVDIGNDITDVLPTALTGSGNLKVSIQEQHGVNLATSTLQGGGLPSSLTGSGNLKVSIEEGSSGGGDASATNQATMITDLGLIKTSLQLLDDIVQGEDASHGNAHKGVMSLAVRQDTQADFGADGDYCPMSIDANGELRVKNISGFATATLQGAGLPSALSSDNLKVSIQEGNISGFSTATLQGAGLPSALSSDNLKVSIQEGNITGFATSTLQGTINTSLATLETSLTSMESKQDTQIIHLSEIEGAVETLEGCVSGSELQVDIVGGGFDGAITNAHLTELGGAINNAKVDVNISSGNISGFATESTLGDAEAHLGTIDTNIANAEAHLGTIDTNIANAEAHLGNIDTGVDVLEACVGSNKVNVNISSGNISGFATSTLQGTINTSLGTLETSLTSMESKQDTQITHLTEIEGAVETLEGSLDKTTTQLLFGTGNLVANGTPESSSNSVELTNNSERITVFLEAQNTMWDAFNEWSYDNSTWFQDQSLNFSGNTTVFYHDFKKGKYLRVKVNNQNGTTGTTNSFVVNVVQ